MTIGERIRSARKEEHLTQVQLAEKAGIAVNSLRLYESGKRSPNIETLEKIISALGIDHYSDLKPILEPVYRSPRSSIYLDRDSMQFLLPDPDKILYEINSRDRSEKVRLYGEKAVLEEEAEIEKISEIYRSENLDKIVSALAKLNAVGQEKAVERVEELTEIQKYKK